MKRSISVLIALASATTVFAQTRADYDAAVTRFQRYYNTKQPDSVFWLFGDRIREAMPLDKTGEMMDKINEQFGAMISHRFTKQDEHFTYYKTEFARGTLTLVVGLTPENKLNNFRFAPYQDDNPATAAEKSNISLKTPTGDIYGTLAMPAGTKKVPVVLIIAGSGPTDRNGNCPSLGLKANTYRLLADSLQEAGIASVRYDKRGVGESASAMKDEESIHFDDMINDAAGFVKMLKADPRFSKVIVLGHSEGSLIGMIAAKREKADMYISVSGIGEKADKILEKQLGKQSEDLAKKAKIVLDSLMKGYTVKDVDPGLNSVLRASIQPYMISWLKYNPAIEIKKLAIPVLILQGNTDIQVDADEADKLKKAYPAARMKIIPEMNHVLKQSTMNMQENVATYSNPALPLCPGLAHEMVKFIKG